MRKHLDLMDRILDRGRVKFNEHTQKKTMSIFGPQLEFDMAEGFPLVTTRKIRMATIVKELLWFLSGSTNNADLKARGVHIWDQWEIKPEDLAKYNMPESMLGQLGPIYGKMWRAWEGSDGKVYDQIARVEKMLRENPTSRRIAVSGWNPALTPDDCIPIEENIANGKQCLPPCHTYFQFDASPLTAFERIKLYWKKVGYGDSEGSNLVVGTDVLDHHNIPKYLLSCKLTARSQDVPVGTVFNIAQYSLLLHMFAHITNMVPGRYIHSMGDTHIYEDQIPAVREQLKRQPLALPRLEIVDRGQKSIDDFQESDFILHDYHHCPHISIPVAK